ncbi:putative cytochrome P450 YjiB [Reticulibacter mediterranei]|uniref:Putative cytochrome P450 YjiB n=1 Tax=Reticulibacter mediterranei TaxID=2778369 RepID=A0A8J3IYL4_9CHLR|nr:cytochrome P450 [Reticulibacter mediterranei]GHP00889.1 putative cytochrome P450 YjiB [Reticulibacter mediterranei]
MQQCFPPIDHDQYARYALMRAESPHFFNAQSGIWEIFDYRTVKRVLNSEEFSSHIVTDDIPTLLPSDRSLIFLDGTDHRRLRKLIQPAFSSQAIALWITRICTIAQELLAPLLKQGTMEVVRDFAAPLPARVIAEMLGVPFEDFADFERWSAAASESAQWQLRGEEWLTTMREMHAYFQTIIRQRRHRACNDLISHLVAANIDGVALSDEEIQSFCVLLLAAGIETTRELISMIFLCLSSVPELEPQLRTYPSRQKQAIEEIMRYRAPVQFQIRRAVHDVSLPDGACIAAGSIVIPYIASANRDEQVFPHADQLDILRDLEPHHLAFGHAGAHFCVGAPLARLEAKIALQLILERLRGIERIDENALESTGIAFGGVKALHVRFVRA